MERDKSLVNRHRVSIISLTFSLNALVHGSKHKEKGSKEIQSLLEIAVYKENCFT